MLLIPNTPGNFCVDNFNRFGPLVKLTTSSVLLRFWPHSLWGERARTGQALFGRRPGTN